jgi:hypothetical protein
MTLNELLTKQNFLSKIQLKNGDAELSKSLKVKVMANRIEYAKVRKQFDEDTQEFIKGLTDEHFQELQNKAERTEEENAELKKLTDEANENYIEYVNGKGNEEVSCKEKKFTEEDFEEILEVNADIDVEINGTKLTAGDFLEIFYTLFIDEENGKD